MLYDPMAWRELSLCRQPINWLVPCRLPSVRYGGCTPSVCEPPSCFPTWLYADSCLLLYGYTLMCIHYGHDLLLCKLHSPVPSGPLYFIALRRLAAHPISDNNARPAPMSSMPV